MQLDTDKSAAREFKTKRQGKVQTAFLASQLFPARTPLVVVKVLVSIMISVGWSSIGQFF